jgi:23S rRNA (adenine2503-C2)-methyltransferase
MTTESFFNFTRAEVADAVGSEARANRLYQAAYREQSPSVDSFDARLPRVDERFESADGTRRYLVRLADGQTIESVLIPESGRHTFCVSSQVGCALACTFCLTGQLGLTRNLAAGEIVSQVLLLRREMPDESSGRYSIVLMGMGEPLQNYENVLKAIEILTDDNGLAVPLRRITLSTAGLLPGIERLARERLFPNLSISLTGARDEVRDQLMPINRKYPIRDVIAAVRDLPERRRKRVMFEYVMIKGLTDSIDDAGRLAALLEGLGAKVNLIPLNESPDIPYQRSDRSGILSFQQVLLGRGITTFIRKTRGDDVSGACGQLKLKDHRGAASECRHG